MSYYRQADGSIPVPPPDEEVITTPTLEDATLAPRRDMFEIVEEVISPNASAQPLTMTRNKNNPAQRRVVNKATQLATQPIATGKPAPAKSKKLSWNSLTVSSPPPILASCPAKLTCTAMSLDGAICDQRWTISLQALRVASIYRDHVLSRGMSAS